jgi:hypothetical protein
MTPYFLVIIVVSGQIFFRLQGRGFNLKKEVLSFFETLVLTDTVEVIPNTKILIFTAMIMSDFLQLTASSSEKFVILNILGDSKLLSGFPWPINGNPAIT